MTSEVPNQNQQPRWRTWVARVVVISAVFLAMFTWQRFQPVECFLSFSLGPSIRAEDGRGMSRGNIREIRGSVVGEDGQEVARLSQALPQGLEGPATPPVVLRIPSGTYELRLEIIGDGDRRALRTPSLEIAGEGYLSLDVD